MKKKRAAARNAGVVPLSPKLGEALAAVRAHEGITGPATALVADVREVEEALKGELPNDLLGYWLATNRLLGGLIDMTRIIPEFYEASEIKSWRKEMKFAHVVFDDDYLPEEGPLCAPLGNEKPAEVLLCFLRRGIFAPPGYDAKKDEPALLSYLKVRYPEVDFEATYEPVEVRLVDAPAKGTRKVTHPKFGEGTVVQEIPPDKIEVDFGLPTGVKKLLRGAWADG